MASSGGRKSNRSKSKDFDIKSSICTDCDKVVETGDDGIECESCVKLFHPVCQKMSADAYTSYKDYQQLNWYCKQRQCKTVQIS